MECAGKGQGTRCTGPAARRCARCGAVAYCSVLAAQNPVSHQIARWPDHKEECGRLEQHLKLMDILNEFPFTFTQEATVQPLTIYYATQVAGLGRWTSGISHKLHIHYLGPEKELLQLSVFSELHALFPNVHVHIELVGQFYKIDGEMIELRNYVHCVDRDCICKSSSETVNWDALTSKPSAVALLLRSGFCHDRYRDIAQYSSPHLIVAPNAGIATYSSWLPTIELIKDMNIPAVFSDYCKEACHLGASCITGVTGCPLNIPIQLNPFRQPMVVEDSILLLPCYSNCLLYGMSKWCV